MIVRLSVLLLAILFISLSCGSKDSHESVDNKATLENDNQKAKDEAIAVAKPWLGLIDNEEYEKSWDETAVIFQNAVSRENWGPTVKNVRSMFGKFINREMKSATYATSLPGVPDGEYVIIQFITKFEKKENAVETITPKKNENGEWQVSGYFIK